MKTSPSSTGPTTESHTSLKDITMSVSNVISEVDHLASLECDLGSNERRELLQACERLKSRLETPFDSVARLAFSVRYTQSIELWMVAK